MLRSLLISFFLLSTSCVTVNSLHSEEIIPVYERIGDSIYRIGGEDGWGTGFVVKARSGKKFILTNDHVCDTLSEGDKVITSTGKQYRVKIKAKYNYHDLCLILAPRKAVALKIANHLSYREDIYTAGFPGIPEMTTTKGIALKIDKSFALPYPLEIKDCKGKKKYKIRALKKMSMFGPIIEDTCMMEAPSQQTSLQLGPGASGSPVVNKHNEVVGVVMSVMSSMSFTHMVPLEAIRDFLDNN